MSASAFSIKDYKRDYWASLDKPYWSIFLLVFLIELVVIIYLQSLPVREMTQEETLAFQRRVFNVLAPPDIEPVKDVTSGEDLTDGTSKEDQGEDVTEEAPAEPIEQQQETVVSRQQRRSQQEAARTQRPHCDARHAGRTASRPSGRQPPPALKPSQTPDRGSAAPARTTAAPPADAPRRSTR